MARTVQTQVETLRNYVGGRWVDAVATETQAVHNPATGEVLARVPLSGGEDVDAAVKAAKEACVEWRATPPQERARYFFTLRQLLDEHRDELACLIVTEMGKTLDDARGEIQRGIENLETACGIPTLMMGYGLENGTASGIDEEVIYQPLGVCTGTTPFNFPFMIAFWFWPYAVATGNPFILKLSEQDPRVQRGRPRHGDQKRGVARARADGGHRRVHDPRAPRTLRRPAVAGGQAATMESEENIVRDVYPSASFSIYSANMDPERSPPFTDVRVRKALPLSVAYAPDRIETVYNFDPDQARELLDEAGWLVGDDGIREKDRARFSFELLYIEGFAAYEQQLPYIQRAWGHGAVLVLLELRREPGRHVPRQGRAARRVQQHAPRQSGVRRAGPAGRARARPEATGGAVDRSDQHRQQRCRRGRPVLQREHHRLPGSGSQLHPERLRALLEPAVHVAGPAVVTAPA